MPETTVQKNRLSNLFPGHLAEVDTFFDHLFGQNAPRRALSGWYAPASLWEEEDRLHLEFDAPGVSREDADITFDKGVLTVTLERKALEDRQYWHNERGHGKVTRSVTLPETVDPDSIEAGLTNGVLHLSIAKLPTAQPRKIELKS